MKMRNAKMSNERRNEMHLNKERIKLIMAQKELSVSEVAERCGKTKQRVSCIFNSINVTPKTAGQIARALEVDVTEIIINE